METAIAVPAAAVTIAAPLSAEDQARADLYALIAALLLRAPDAALLSGLAAADALRSEQSGHPLDLAWEQLSLAAGLLDADTVREEFNTLFIGIGTPLLDPYGSHYLSGFMMEKPLASLRDDLRMLGLRRGAGVGEPEDHLGALCEAMRLLIGGMPNASPRSLRTQKTFFIKHVAPWYGRALDDIRDAAGANFYRCVALFAHAFLDVEFEAFEMEDMMENDSGADLEQR